MRHHHSAHPGHAFHPLGRRFFFGSPAGGEREEHDEGYRANQQGVNLQSIMKRGGKEVNEFRRTHGFADRFHDPGETVAG